LGLFLVLILATACNFSGMSPFVDVINEIHSFTRYEGDNKVDIGLYRAKK